MKKATLLFLVILSFACEEQVTKITLDNGYDFYPLELGNYWVYEVEKVDILGFIPDTSRYYLREELTDTLLSESGIVKYFLERQVSQDQINWEVDSVWTVHRLDQALVVSENNLPLIKLTFPVKVGGIWDGNAYNNQAESLFYYETTDLDIDSLEAVRVVLSDIKKNIVNQDERSEIYERGVGLISKEYIKLNFCSVNCEFPGEIESGMVLIQKLIEHGQN